MGSYKPPLLDPEGYDTPSVFQPEALLEGARRQKKLPETDVPDVCVLDPDGDVVDHLVSTDEAERDPNWPGYHTDLYRFDRCGAEHGIVGCAVGAPFAVLVAEQLFASGCELLVSVTSSGQITSRGETPYFVLIDRALRDEGTSYHYAPPSRYADADESLIDTVEDACENVPHTVHRGATWTTDAPFHETEEAIEDARTDGVLGVGMEASALYTFANVRDEDVVCFAHVTNEMGTSDDEFEKGEESGTEDALGVVDAARRGWGRDGV